MLARDLLGLVENLLEASGAQTEKLATLTSDDGDDRTFTAADERHERGEVEVATDADPVGYRVDQRARPPHVVEAGREEHEPVRPISVEVVLEVLADSLEVGLEAATLVVRQATVVRARAPLCLREEGVEARVRVPGRRHDARVEIDVQADRTALLGAEIRQLAEPLPGHALGHASSFRVGAAILCAWLARSPDRSRASV